MKHTQVFFPGLTFSKRNRCFLKEAVGYIMFYTSVFTFGLNLDSTPHEYKSKAVWSYPIQLSCSRFFPCACSSAAQIWNDSVYTPVDIQGGRGAPFPQGMEFSIPLHIPAGQKNMEPTTQKHCWLNLPSANRHESWFFPPTTADLQAKITTYLKYNASSVIPLSVDTPRGAVPILVTIAVNTCAVLSQTRKHCVQSWHTLTRY